VLELEHFRGKGDVLLPGVDPNSARAGADGGVTGTQAIAAVIAHGTATPDEKLLVTGHAPEPSAKTRSQNRADDAVLALTADDQWPAHAAGLASIADAQLVLKWASDTFQLQCDPGDADGSFGPATRNAFSRFVAGYRAQPLTGKRSAPGLADSDAGDGRGTQTMWSAFFDLYYEDIARWLGLPSSDAARAQAQALAWFADGASPPPSKPSKFYLLIRSIDQVFPVKLSKIATGTENNWELLNPLNPDSLLDRNNPSAGWRDMKPGERIYLVAGWETAIKNAGYDVRDENHPELDPKFDDKGRPLPHPHLIIQPTDSLWPVKIAEKAGHASEYKKLEPLNPHLMRGPGQWKDLYANDQINLPDDWADALRAQYVIEDDPKITPPPPPSTSTGKRANPCQAHHLDAPFASGQPRRGSERRAEAIFGRAPDEPLRICESDDPACTTDSCDLYDPREYRFAYQQVAAALPVTVQLTDPRWLGDVAPDPVEPFTFRLFDYDLQPSDDVDVVVIAGERRAFARSDSAGRVTVELPHSTDGVTLRWTPDDTAQLVDWPIKLALPPASQDAGVHARLANLGYPIDQDEAFALCCFQRDQGLPLTARIDDATRAAVIDVHDGAGQRAAARPPTSGASLMFLVGGENPLAPALPDARAWMNAVINALGGGAALDELGTVDIAADAVERASQRAALGALSDAALDQHAGGLRGHTLVLAATGLETQVPDDAGLRLRGGALTVAELKNMRLDGDTVVGPDAEPVALVDAIRQSIFAQVYLACFGLGRPLDELAALLAALTDKTVYFNAAPINFAKNGGAVVNAPGRAFYAAFDAPANVTLKSPPDGFLAGAEGRSA
jgi:hypothetical protein